MRQPVILRLIGSAARAWWDDDCTRLGASLAYYTLFAIAPVLLVATAIAGSVFGPEAVRGEIVGQLDRLVGREGALAVESLLEGASQRRAGTFATVVGGIAFLVAATGAFLELQVALNTIWRVKPNTGANIKAFLMDRLRRSAWWSRLFSAAGVALGDGGIAVLNAGSSISPCHAGAVERRQHAVLAGGDDGVFALLFRSCLTPSALARRDDRRRPDGGALHDRAICHRFLPGQSKRRVELRRPRVR